MKVLLVRPPAPNALSFTKILDNEPLELEYLYTSLVSRGHNAVIYDGLVERQSLKETLLMHMPDIVAVTGYITQENVIKNIALLAKDICPKAKVVLGGVHVQLNAHRMSWASVDFLCLSECTNTFVDLVERIENHVTSYSDLNGVGFKVDGLWQFNPLKPMDINTLPIPDRSYFYAHQHHYRYLEFTGVATMKTAFSCPHTCSFCYCTLLAGGQYRARRLDLVIDEIEGIQADVIQIVDDDFIVDPARVWAFVEQIRLRGIKKKFICYARADGIAKHPELIAALAEIGFTYFLVGLEAITDAALQSYDKKVTAEINAACINVVENTTARLIALLIVSHEACAEDFEDLYNFVVQHKLVYVTVSIFTPIPGTPLFEAYKDKIISDNIEDWDFLHLVVEPTKLSKSAFYRAYFKLFIKLYWIAKQSGIYDFMDLSYYYTLIKHYFTRKMKE